MSGKGSKARPFSVDQKTFDNNWDTIFNKKEVPTDKDHKDGYEGKQSEKRSDEDKDR